MKASLNLRGPSRKAKYSLATDSAPVARAKGGKNPDKGRIVNLKPHAYKRSEPYGGTRDEGRGARREKPILSRPSPLALAPQWVMACLLHNDPATYRHGQG